MGSPLVNQEGMALFGHGRDSRPVVNPKEKLLMVGGKPVLGLDLPHLRTTTTATTAAPTTTTPELPTPKWITEESTTPLLFPTCPPGTFSRTDEYGNPVLDPDGILDCYPEGKSLTHVSFGNLIYFRATVAFSTNNWYLNKTQQQNVYLN